MKEYVVECVAVCVAVCAVVCVAVCAACVYMSMRMEFWLTLCAVVVL